MANENSRTGDSLPKHLPTCAMNVMNKCDCVGVYLPNKKSESFRVLRDVARYWRNNGLARFINHANDIRLTFVPTVNLRGASCTVNAQMIWRYVNEDQQAIEIINSWR